MMNNPIKVFMPSGEAREPKLRQVIEKDKQNRFEWVGNSSDIPGDIQFRERENENIEKVFNVELKDFSGDKNENSDLLSSILNGHLYLQTLKLRASGQPCAIVVLGNEEDLKNACMKSVYHRGLRAEEATDIMVSYENMVWDLEANCRGQNIGFWWLKSVPWRRILSDVHKILTKADLSRYAPKPVGVEEQAVALSILLGHGIGPIKAKSVLDNFQLLLEPWCEDTYLTDVKGIGEKLANQIAKSKNVAVDQMHVIRPKAKKPSLSEGGMS